MERLLRASERDVPAQKRVLEINPDHVLVQRLKALNESDLVQKTSWSLCSCFMTRRCLSREVLLQTRSALRSSSPLCWSG